MDIRADYTDDTTLPLYPTSQLLNLLCLFIASPSRPGGTFAMLMTVSPLQRVDLGSRIRRRDEALPLARAPFAERSTFPLPKM